MWKLIALLAAGVAVAMAHWSGYQEGFEDGWTRGLFEPNEARETWLNLHPEGPPE
jgi:hypothetical protein